MNGWLDKDQITGVLKIALDILVAKNPVATSIGGFFGVLLHGLVNLFDPVLKQQQIVDLTRVNWYFYFCFGVFLFNIPSLLRRPRLDPQFEALLASIAKARREGVITHVDAKLRYNNLFDRALSQIVLNQETLEKLREFRSEVQQFGRPSDQINDLSSTLNNPAP